MTLPGIWIIGFMIVFTCEVSNRQRYIKTWELFFLAAITWPWMLGMILRDIDGKE